MKLSQSMKRMLIVGSFLVSPFVFSLLGIGGSSASALVVNYGDAVNAINGECASGKTMGHAAYGENPRLNDATGVVTYDLVILWKRCNGSYVGEYAVTGYNGDACPIVGMYHNGAEGTRDCVKYSSRHNSMPSCGSFRCVYRPAWDNYAIWQGYDGGPGDYNLHSKVFYGRTVAISNWAAKTQSSGSEYVFVSTLCDYYSSVSNRVCQDTYVYVSWVRLNFNLTPTITVNPTISEGSSPVTANPTVNNSGSTTSSNAQWQVVKFTLNAGLPIPGAGRNNTIPTSHYANGSTIVSQGSRTFPRNITNMAAIGQNLPDLPVGTRICFALSVQPLAHNDSRWNHSTPACVTIAKKPKVQILGGDLMVGRGTAYNPAATSRVATSTSYSSTTNLYYGSWSEYAIIPSGTVTGMASGALYVGGRGDSNLCNLSLLTIANNTGTGCQAASIGRYVSGSTAPEVATRFPVTSNISSGSVDLFSLAPSQVYSVSGNTLNVSSSQPFNDNGAGKGRWVVINDPDVTVRITGNLNYASSATLTQIDDIPQIVIIARNIIIDPGVDNVDAWLIAVGSGSEGYINTCSSVASGSPTSATLNNTTCNKKLTVNGPLLANKLYLYRTFGANPGASLGDPSEVFNLRADAYIWASAYSPGNGRVPTVSTKELPPRF